MGVEVTMSYNGWANRQTWNVALWIGNDEGLYHMAKEIAASTPEDESPYTRFRQELRDVNGDRAISYETPDQVAWNDAALDVDRLDDMMREL